MDQVWVMVDLLVVADRGDLAAAPKVVALLAVEVMAGEKTEASMVEAEDRWAVEMDEVMAVEGMGLEDVMVWVMAAVVEEVMAAVVMDLEVVVMVVAQVMVEEGRERVVVAAKMAEVEEVRAAGILGEVMVAAAAVGLVVEGWVGEN